jgi:hypothetical protein
MTDERFLAAPLIDQGQHVHQLLKNLSAAPSVALIWRKLTINPEPG